MNFNICNYSLHNVKINYVHNSYVITSRYSICNYFEHGGNSVNLTTYKCGNIAKIEEKTMC